MDQFEINRLGRLVINRELQTGSCLSSEAWAKTQPNPERYLKERLEALGGQKLRATHFSIDCENRTPGFTFGEKWNGWAVPYFTKEQADKIMARIEGCYYQPEADSYMIPTGYEDEPFDECIGEEIDGVTYYQFGNGWCWGEDIRCPDCDQYLPCDCKQEPLGTHYLENLEERAIQSEGGKVELTVKEVREIVHAIRELA